MAYKNIIISSDSTNPEIKVKRFMHNGMEVIVPLGKVTKVPEWVVTNNPRVFTGENAIGQVLDDSK